MSDPHESGYMNVSVKQDEPGGKFNDPKSPGSWMTFTGSPERVREMMLETFGIEDFDGKLYQLVQEGTELFKATSNVRQGLGAKPLATSDNSNVVPFKKKEAADGGADEVFKQAAEGQVEPPAPAADPILEAIEAASTIEAITRVRAENAEAIKPGSDYWDAYVAKGKALKNGGGAA